MRTLIVLVASMTTLSVSGCSKPSAEPVDAGAVAVATPDGGTGSAAVATPATAPGATMSTPATTPSGVMASTGGAFQGSFPGCLTGGLKTSQTGGHVVGHSGDNYDQKVAHDVINFSCSIAGAVCSGTATTVNKSPTGKITPQGAPRKMTFVRKIDGTFQFSQDGQAAPTMCGRPS
jgi:hypothetical protein